MSNKVSIESLRNDPSRLRDLSPRQFEEVVAELLASFGWEVSLTSATRDGGYDVLGISSDVPGLQTSWVVECKHYKSDHKVGVETIRQLYGVKQSIGVPNAVVVTTSEFTKDAREFSATRNDIQLVDFAAISSWLGSYQSPSTNKTYIESKKFSSCFVSYSTIDQPFAEKLVAALRARNIRTWFAPEDLRPGEKLAEQVTRAIQLFDRLIVVLSTHSMKSNWVASEIALALRKEQEEGQRVLFPISLVAFDELRSWSLFDADTGLDMTRVIRSYYIPYFKRWDGAEFESEVSRIVETLSQAPASSERR